jgi:aryl-alcohol dehydrogenase-like predicted oxidoreductase
MIAWAPLQATQILARAAELGVNFIDTANMCVRGV